MSERGRPNEASRRCGICGRDLVDWRTCAPDDPAMDCGGDCLACMREFEGRPVTSTVHIGAYNLQGSASDYGQDWKDAEAAEALRQAVREYERDLRSLSEDDA